MSTRSSSTVAWSIAVGWIGALAIGAAGLVLTVVLDVVSTGLEVVAGASMALCLAVAGGGGWTLAGAPDGLTPRWLAGLAAGLLGVAAGAAVFAIRFGFTPI